MHHDGIPIAEDDDGNVLYRMPMPPHIEIPGQDFIVALYNKDTLIGSMAFGAEWNNATPALWQAYVMDGKLPSEWTIWIIHELYRAPFLVYMLNAINTHNNDASLGEYLGQTFLVRDDAESAADYLNGIHRRGLVEVVELDLNNVPQNTEQIEDVFKAWVEKTVVDPIWLIDPDLFEVYSLLDAKLPIFWPFDEFKTWLEEGS